MTTLIAVLRDRGQENLRHGVALDSPELHRPWMSSLLGTHKQHQHTA